MIKKMGAPSVPMRWLMSKAQAAQIAKRLRDLRDASKRTDSPITVPMVARHCQVAVRTAAGWLSAKNPKPMTYQHAVKAAKLFKVEPEWLWDGKEKRPVPDLMGQLTTYDKALREVEAKVATTAEKLDAIQEGVDELLELVAPLAASRLLEDADQAIPEPRSRTSRARTSSAKPRQAAKRRAGSQ